MKKSFVFVLFLSLGFVACKNEKKAESQDTVVAVEEVKKEIQTVEEGTYVANLETSVLNWKGSKPTGTHNGTVSIQDGSFTVAEGALTGGSFSFDMGTITVLDIPADNDMNGKLTGHLKSGDFFDVENNPTSTFVITSVDATEGVVVTGDLTVKGITQSISFPAELASTEDGVVLKGAPFTIDRTKFGIEYKSKSIFDDLKDKFIDDEFEISFEVNAAK